MEHKDANSKDRNVTRAVPYVILASLICGLAFAATGELKIGPFLLRFCFPFVMGFAVLGAYAFLFREKGILDRRMTAVAFLLTPAVISLFLLLFTTYVLPDLFNLFDRLMPDGTNIAVTAFVTVYSFTLVMTLAGHGVISTVVSYFRKYTARIYLSIEKMKNDGTDTRRNKISRWVYDIPKIIDIERIELEPAEDDGKFPMRTFYTLALSTFLLGLAVSSYIFLNPIFEMTMTLEEAIIVTSLITFFIPVLVVPWLITRDIGAKVKSQARDYYLWKGMKSRLYAGAFAFMMFFSLFAISMYFGYDIVRATYTYVGYVAITVYLSLIYAFIYTNYYHKGFREGIIKNFNEAKKRDR